MDPEPAREDRRGHPAFQLWCACVTPRRVPDPPETRPLTLTHASPLTQEMPRLLGTESGFPFFFSSKTVNAERPLRPFQGLASRFMANP